MNDAPDPLDARMDDFELSARSANCLDVSNIQTMRDLVGQTEQDLMRMPNFGKVSLAEVKALLESLGLALRQPNARDGTPPIPFPSLHERLREIERRLTVIERHPALREVGQMSKPDGPMAAEHGFLRSHDVPVDSGTQNTEGRPDSGAST